MTRFLRIFGAFVFLSCFTIFGLADAKLPLDPGDAGKATLEGIDINHNRIRDDVEIYIAVNFGKSLKIKQGLNQYAISIQLGLLATTEQESMSAADAQIHARECLKYIDSKDKSWQNVFAQMINTPQRFSAWAAHDTRLGGKVFSSQPMNKWKSSCSFNPDE